MLDEWGGWLSTGWDWQWWVTLTFDPKRNVGKGSPTHGRMEYDPTLGREVQREVVGWSQSARFFDEWLAASLGDSSGTGVLPGSIYFVRGREPNPHRYGTHFHALIGGVTTDASRRAAWVRWSAKHGNARIVPYNPAWGAGRYLSKYVVKELGDITFSANLGLHARSTSDG